MTAINVILKRDRGILMTDAAFYTPQGLIVGFGQKAIALPTLKAAIACRGAQKLAALLAMELSIRFPDFDTLLDAGPDHFAFWAETIGDQLQLHTDADTSAIQDVEMVVVGWSDARKKAVGFFYATTQDPAFAEIDEWAFGPLPSDEEDANLHAVGCEMDVDIEAGGFDPIRHGIPTMEAQRRMKLVPLSSDLDEPVSIVGGNILLTEVSAAGVSQRVVHRWADEIGENIYPAAFQKPPSVSRAERRRLERAA